MERRHKLQQPEIIKCPNLAVVYDHLEKVMARESALYQAILPNLPNNSACRSKRQTVEDPEVGSVAQVEVRYTAFLLTDDEINIHIASSRRLVNDGPFKTQVLPASCLYHSKTDISPSRLVFTYSPEVAALNDDPELSHMIYPYIVPGVEIVPFQYFRDKEKGVPSWHFVTNMAELLNQVKGPVLPEYDNSLPDDLQLFLDDEFASYGGTYLPFMTKVDAHLEFNPGFLLSEGPLAMHHGIVPEADSKFVGSLDRTYPHYTLVENPFSSQ